jgi:hypothetical protein
MAVSSIVPGRALRSADGTLAQCGISSGETLYYLRDISMATGILDWLRFTYVFEIGSP